MKCATLAMALLLLTGAATPPIADPGFKPQDSDERGLWMQVDEAERQFKTSNFVIRDPALNAYVRQVFCRTVGAEACAPVRIYIVRTPWFNASMAPNGMMQIWSGLFLRCRDEAQLAAVLGHEYNHFRARHSLRQFREIKAKTDAMAWMSVVPVGGAIAGGIALAQLGLVGSVYANSREMEREADTGSLPMLAQGGYDPRAASRIWAQLRAEDDARALDRKRRKRSEGGMLATHPASAEREAELGRQAQALTTPATTDLGATRYRAALAPLWPTLIDDQIKLNDYGATALLLGHLAADGWTGELLYAQGELARARGKPEDFAAAATSYRAALAKGDAPLESWRGLGLALMRAGDATGGKAALSTYLAKRPDAPDQAMLAMLVKGAG